MAPSVLLSLKFTEVFVVDLLLADSDLFGVGEGLGHPLLRVAFTVLLFHDCDLHSFEVS